MKCLVSELCLVFVCASNNNNFVPLGPCRSSRSSTSLTIRSVTLASPPSQTPAPLDWGNGTLKRLISQQQPRLRQNQGHHANRHVQEKWPGALLSAEIAISPSLPNMVMPRPLGHTTLCLSLPSHTLLALGTHTPSHHTHRRHTLAALVFTHHPLCLLTARWGGPRWRPPPR